MAQVPQREFLDLVKAIGESKSKQEEDRIVAEEVHFLKKKIPEQVRAFAFAVQLFRRGRGSRIRCDLCAFPCDAERFAVCCLVHRVCRRRR